VTRFLHTADWQLGMTRHFLSPEAQGRFAQDRIDAVREIGVIAREQRAEFVVVCGDVFESNQVERQTVVRALDAIATIGVPVLLLPGNHDPLDAVSVYRSPTFEARRPENVIVLDSPLPMVPPGCEGVEIVAAPWTSKRPLCDLVEQACRELAPSVASRATGTATGTPAGSASAGITRICVGHGAVDSLSPDRDDPSLIDVERAEAALREGRIHYLALGDRHSATRVGSSQRIAYSGSPVATDFRETRPGLALCVEVSAELDQQPQVEEFPVGRWRFVEQRFSLDSEDDVASLRDWLQAQPDKERTIVRLALVGSLTLRGQAMLHAALDDWDDAFASLRIWQRHTELVTLPDSLDRTALSLSGYAQRTWDALILAAQSDSETGVSKLDDAGDAGDARSSPAREARDALALLYRLADGAAGSAKL
jgi:DNA repair exonuclease SbcCD nuclease subunit